MHWEGQGPPPLPPTRTHQLQQLRQNALHRVPLKPSLREPLPDLRLRARLPAQQDHCL